MRGGEGDNECEEECVREKLRDRVSEKGGGAVRESTRGERETGKVG